MNIKRSLVLSIILLAILVWAVIAVYPNWLWFKNLDFSSVFWTMIIARFGLVATIWLSMIVILTVNLYIAQRLNPADGQRPTTEIGGYPVSGHTVDNLILAAVLIVSFIIALRPSGQWNMILSFLNQQPFGTHDPIFNKDIGFYVFSMPFYMFVREQLLILFLFTGLVTVIWYIKDGGVQFVSEYLLADSRPGAFPKVKIAEHVANHLLALSAVMVLLVAWGYHLQVYDLLYSTQGPATGASYTDVQIRIPVFRILMAASALWCIILIYSAFKPRVKLLFISGAVWACAILLLQYALPAFVQQFVVKPNELAKESPYIAHNIDFTRQAYNLDSIEEVDFVPNERLNPEDLSNNDLTIQNIRIWDEAPLLQTYRQIQSIRLYYDFINVDVDRYSIDNRTRQVILSAREMVVNQLPQKARTWVNRHLIYTHGYGLAMSPVNEVTREGLPQLMIKDIPPSSGVNLEIDRPEIYYGEKTDDYILTKTSAREFNYPKGDENVYADYQGNGGVPINSFVKRLLFAAEFRDPQLIFTDYLQADSRIMFNRRIDKRAHAIAPFLAYDTDPYMVLSQGRLFWIQDAYTISGMFPYSKRSKSPFRKKWLNYIRNSVKVVIDAYNGDVHYYMIDAKDPILKTYAGIYPDLFRSFDEMPAGLKAHLRYPNDLFEIQANTYTKYHMQDVQVFYNQEDLWEPPDEIYGSNRQIMKPYYIIVKLPQEDKEEFLLMLPFTPSKKDNMIGWLAARCDVPHYGNLIVYKLPKEKLAYGPMQIEARVDQQTEISRELSLWDQRGSRIIRGNLLAIPMNNAFLYVEPIYLEAKQEPRRPLPVPSSATGTKSQNQQKQRPARKDISMTAALPELKRVIVALGDRVVMEENLEQALNRVLDRQAIVKPTRLPAGSQSGAGTDLGARALEHYNKAKAFLNQGDWTEYGKELEKLENILKQLAEPAAGKD